MKVPHKSHEPGWATISRAATSGAQHSHQDIATIDWFLSNDVAKYVIHLGEPEVGPLVYEKLSFETTFTLWTRMEQFPKIDGCLTSRKLATPTSTLLGASAVTALEAHPRSPSPHTFSIHVVNPFLLLMRSLWWRISKLTGSEDE